MDTKPNADAPAKDATQYKTQITMPYALVELNMARQERTVKRMLIGWIITIVLLVASQVAWLLYLNQYDVVSYDMTQDGEANIIGEDNEIYNGPPTFGNQNQEKEG